MKNSSLLSQGAIKEYQEIYKNVFGKDISQNEASEQGIKLLRLFKLVYRSIKEESINKLKT